MNKEVSQNSPNPVRRPTLRDVADLAGVHPSAVSRVVTNDPTLSLTEATRNRILKAIEELGYASNAAARSLRTSKTWTIGMALPDLSNPLYQQITLGAQQCAADHGYGMVVGGQKGGDIYGTFRTMLEEGRVDGLLIASIDLTDAEIRDLSDRAHGRVVVVNRLVEGLPHSAILEDQRGTELAIGHLMSHDHSHIAGVFGPAHADTTKRRMRGFRVAMAASASAGLELVMPGWTSKDGYDATRRILREQPETTAIYASTLLMALGCLKAAHDAAVRVPVDLSVVSLHDGDLADYTTPALSTVRLPTHELGAMAVEVLLSRSRGEDRDQPLVVEGAELVSRESVALVRLS